MTPQSDTVISLDDEDTSRTYTVATDEAITIALVDTDNVEVDEDGVVSFAGQATTGAGATRADLSEADLITRVNGGAIVATDQVVASPVNGQVTFTVGGDADQANESVTPVVFEDTNTDGTLQIAAATGQPTEDFGIGGSILFLPAEQEATADAEFEGEVTLLNVAERWFTLFDEDADPGEQTYLFRFKQGDAFAVGGVAVPFDTFVAHLSAPGGSGAFAFEGDTVDVGAYAPGGVSSFNITTDIVGAPTSVSASLRNNNTDLRVSFTPPANLGTDNDDYGIYAFNVDPDADTPVIPVATGQTRSLVTGGVDIEDIAEDLEVGETYVIRVRANDGAATAGPLSASSNPITVPVPADDAAPEIDSAQVVRNVDDEDGEEDILDAGDQIRIEFTERVVLAADATFEISDGEEVAGPEWDADTTAELIRGENATFTLSSNGLVLIITLTDAPVVTDFEGNLVLDIDSLALTDASGVEDAAGNALEFEDDEYVLVDPLTP